MHITYSDPTENAERDLVFLIPVWKLWVNTGFLVVRMSSHALLH